MFRAIAALKKSEGFEVTNHSDYVTQQTRTFTRQYPNLIPTSGNTTSTLVKNNASSALQTLDPNTRQSSLRDIDITTYVQTLQESETLKNLKNGCANAQIENVTSVPGQAQNLKCGWIYKKGTPGNIPAVSKGALGVRKGPIDSQDLVQGGKWYWDLEEAKKDILIDRCSALGSCQDVGNTEFQGCAYSTQRGSGIPVNANGSIKYPNDTRFSGILGTLVTQRSQCPTIPPATSVSDSTLFASSSSAGRDTCIPDPTTGRLPRDCYLDQIKLAGCSDTGSLYLAMSQTTNPNNYMGGLTDQTAYKKYQQLATTPLAETTLRSGQATAAAALQSFQVLKAASSSDQNTAINFAARDLCLQKGTMDSFDFCSELTGTTAAPFSLDCLQKAFKQAGGQETGSVYPSQSNLSQWNSFGTWGNVLNKINDLKQNVSSIREEIQRDALANFLGIQRAPYERGQIGRIQGIEVLWFNKTIGTFLGRRLTGGAAAKFPRIETGPNDEIGGTGYSGNAHIQYVSLVNIRPPSDQQIKMQLTIDDSVLYTLNTQPILKTLSPNQTDTSNEISYAYKWGPVEKNTCWSLKANEPNYVSGIWTNEGGAAKSIILYKSCTGTDSYKELPDNWLNLTQEPDAPILSWQVTQDEFQERRMPYFFDFRVTGGQVSNRNIGGYPYVKELKLGSRSSYAKLMRNMAFNSWRSIGLSFFASENTGASTTGFILFQIGDAITVRLLGKDVLVNINTATLTNVNKRFTNVIDNTNSQPNYLFINCKRDGGQTQGYPNRITIAVGQASVFRSGNVNIEIQGTNVTSYTTSGSQPVFTATDSAEFSLGDKTAVSSAICTIGALRVFDYEMLTSDIQRDIANEWKMKFL
jgi:hypothetical protein